MNNIFNKNNKKKTMILLVLLFVLAFISISYALLSSTLTFKFNKITQEAITWNVHFKEQTTTPIVSGTGAAGRSCGVATAVGTTVSVTDTKLSKPGDKCVWSLVVQNEGSLNATLSNITGIAPTGTNVTCTPSSPKNKITCGNIIYKLTTDDDGSTLLPYNSTQDVSKKSGDTPGELTIYLTAVYYSTSTTLDLQTQIVQTGAQFNLTFSQK